MDAGAADRSLTVLADPTRVRILRLIRDSGDGRVLVGDPARGTRAMSRARFEDLWDNGVLFVIHNRREVAQFNQPRDWRTAPPAPLQSGIGRRGLHDVVVPKLGPGDI